MRHLRPAVLSLLVVLLPAGCRRHVRDEKASALDAVPASPAPERAAPVPAERVTIEGGFANVVDRVAAAVVNISSTRVVRPPSPEQIPFYDDPLFRELFGHGGRLPQQRREQSLGSGVIVSRDGYVLTNVHVVQGGSEIRVSLPDKRELRATVIGQDPKTDIALLRIPGDGFPFARFGDSSKVRVGDFALAIGDPLGLGQTVTMGIISAKGRGNVGIVDYEDFIQTDAAINPGNSGGALVDVSGDLIGINTAIATSGGARGNQGIGFAVPANLAREVMAEIEKHGRVIRGWLGVAVQDVTPPMATALGLPTQGGALVGDVTPDSPAARAGLERGDVVLDLAGKPVVDSRELRLRISEASPGTKLPLVVLRNGARRDVTATLGEMPSDEQRPGAAAPSVAGAMGIELSPLTPDLAHRLNLPETVHGAVVTGVQPGSRAAEAGLRPGDVIQEIDKTPVRSPQDLKKALGQDSKRTHLALVLREGITHYVAIPPEGE
jgi:serine protease Do